MGSVRIHTPGKPTKNGFSLLPTPYLSTADTWRLLALKEKKRPNDGDGPTGRPLAASYPAPFAALLFVPRIPLSAGISAGKRAYHASQRTASPFLPAGDLNYPGTARLRHHRRAISYLEDLPPTPAGHASRPVTARRPTHDRLGPQEWSVFLQPLSSPEKETSRSSQGYAFS